MSRFLGILLLVSTVSAFGGSEPKEYPLSIRVYEVESHPYTTTSGGSAQTNCTYGDYSANCNTSSNSVTWRHVQNTMLVEASDGKLYTIACTANVRWSKCRWLRAGEFYRARWDKHGIAVVYATEKGKQQEQTYSVLGSRLRPTPPVQPATAVRPEPAKQIYSSSGNLATTLEVTSRPEGADIEIDGKFVGNTPSSLGVAAGEHTIKVSRNGFKPWERKLQTSSGNVKVAAELEEQQRPATSK